MRAVDRVLAAPAPAPAAVARVTSTVLSGALLVLAPAVARADAPWTAPAEIGPHVARTASPTLDFLRAGVPLMSWRVRAAEPTTLTFPEPDRVLLATRAPDGAVLSRTLRDDVVRDVTCGPGCVAVMRQRTAARQGERSLLRVSVGAGRGVLGRPQTIARYADPLQFVEGLDRPDGPVIAADRGGSVAVAWIEAMRIAHDGSTHGYRLRLAMRASGGRFGRPRTVAEAGHKYDLLRQPRLDFHGPGAVTVAYVRERQLGTHRRRVVEARLMRRRAAPRAIQVIGPAPESFTDLQVAAAPGGRTVIAWGNVHGTVSGFKDHWVVRAALRPATATRFAPAQVLDRGAVEDAGAPGRVGAAIAPDGTATVAWSSVAAAQPVNRADVRTATAPRGHRFGRPQTITSTAMNAMADLAVSLRGAALVTWTASGSGRDTSVMAAWRPAGAAMFGPPERLATLVSSWLNAIDPAPAAAIDDATGTPAVAWAADATAGAPPLHVPLSAILRLATRETNR
jgi:hypothetical protein